MSGDEFLRRTEYLLSDLPEDETRDALDYYRDYLAAAEEAGDTVEEALREFGSPERLASIIRSDIQGGLSDGGEFTDTGYRDERFREPNRQLVRRGAEGREEKNGASFGEPNDAGTASAGRASRSQENSYAGQPNESESRNAGSYVPQEVPATTGGSSAGSGAGGAYEENGSRRARPHDGWFLKFILALVLVFVVLPVLLGIGGGIIGILTAAVVLILVALILVAVLTVVFMAVGIAGIAAGIGAMFVSLLDGVMGLGVGLVFFGLGLFGLVLSILFYGKMLPWLLRGSIDGIGRLFHGRGRGA